MRLIACLAALIVLSGCKTTNMSWLNDNRKKEVYSDKATCGIVIAKSGINPYQSWKNAARSVPHPKSFFNCWDGPYEEGQLLRRCRSQFGEKCYITFYKHKETGENSIYWDGYASAVSSIKEELDKKVRDSANAIQQAKLSRWSQTCEGFGYVAKTDQHKSCMLELFKLDKQSNAATNNNDFGAVGALLEEQKRQRELEGSLELMQRGLDMMRPKPSVKCQFNRIMNTMTCN